MKGHMLYQLSQPGAPHHTLFFTWHLFVCVVNSLTLHRWFLDLGTGPSPGSASVTPLIVTNKRLWFPVSKYAPHFGELYLTGSCPLNYSRRNPVLAHVWVSLPWPFCYPFCGLSFQVSPSFAKDGDWIPFSFPCYCFLRGEKIPNQQSLPTVLLVLTLKWSKHPV